MILCENLVKIYKIADLEVFALQGLDLLVDDGELMAIIGNSGSGKSTLLNLIGGLDRPTAGRLVVDGKDLLRLSDKELMYYKRQTVGFVWQNNARNLLPYLSALQNVEVPMLLRGRARRERAKELLEMVGLSGRMHNRLAELSGGEQQRVAIAIALANQPRLLLADEPTGNVDTKTAAMILDIFRELNRTLGLTIVIVTHDLALAKKVDRIVAIRDGKTSSEMVRRTASVPGDGVLRRDLDARNDEQALVEAAESHADTRGTVLRSGPAADRSEPAAITAQAAEHGLSAVGETGEENAHVEYAVLDRAGRLQIPAELLAAMGGERVNKLRVQLENGRIVLTPPGV